MTYCLPLEAVIAIHGRFADGGGLRDCGSLEGTLARPMHTGFGQELYPTVVAKAAALLHGFARTQPFENANKRTAWTCCVVYLQQHDLVISAEVTQDEVVEFVFATSVGEFDVLEVALQLLEWLE